MLVGQPARCTAGEVDSTDRAAVPLRLGTFFRPKTHSVSPSECFFIEPGWLFATLCHSYRQYICILTPKYMRIKMPK